MAEDAQRVAIVTGAGSGLGAATARMWQERFGPVVGVDLDEATLAPIVDAGGAAVAGDVTDDGLNERAVATAVERFGRLDTVVLNAGISGWGGVETQPMADFDRIMAINVRAVAVGLRCAAPALKRTQGSAVVISSVSGLAGDPDHFGYCTSKAAVANLARSAAVDLAKYRVRVNVVAPGPVHTDLTRPIADTDPDKYEGLRRSMPLQRWGEPEEVAEVICFLAGPQASFVTAAVVPVDGGVAGRSGLFLPPELDV